MVSKAGKEIRFHVTSENDKKRWRMMTSLPSIEMEYDNDADS